MTDLINFLTVGYSDAKLIVVLCCFMLIISLFQIFGGGRRA